LPYPIYNKSPKAQTSQNRKALLLSLSLSPNSKIEMSGYPQQPAGYGYGQGPPPPQQSQSYGSAPPYSSAYGAPPQPSAPYGTAPQPTAPYGSAQHAAPYGTAQQAAPYGSSQHTAPYGTAQAYGSPYAAPPPGTKPPKEKPQGSTPGGYPPAPYASSPFAALLPSTFPPGTDPSIVACFQVADQDGSGIIDDKELQRALSGYNQSFSLRTVHLLMYLFTNSNARKIGESLICSFSFMRMLVD
jgi:calcium-binding protein CML